MPNDAVSAIYEQHEARMAALADIQRICQGFAAGGQHVLVLNDYQVANLRELFNAMGYACVVDDNPLKVAHTGDWVGEIYNQLPYVGERQKPNATVSELAQRARKWSA